MEFKEIVKDTNVVIFQKSVVYDGDTCYSEIVTNDYTVMFIPLEEIKSIKSFFVKKQTQKTPERVYSSTKTNKFFYFSFSQFIGKNKQENQYINYFNGTPTVVQRADSSTLISYTGEELSFGYGSPENIYFIFEKDEEEDVQKPLLNVMFLLYKKEKHYLVFFM